MKIQLLKPLTLEQAAKLLDRLDDSCSKPATRDETRAALLAFLRCEGLIQTYLGVAVLNARLKKKLKDREARIAFIDDRQALVGWDDGTARLDVQRASDLKIRNWNAKIGQG